MVAVVKEECVKSHTSSITFIILVLVLVLNFACQIIFRSFKLLEAALLSHEPTKEEW